MKSISINGIAVVTRDENQRVKFIQFLPDDEFTPVLEQSSKTSGQLQLLRNAAFEVMTDLMGTERMREILKEALKRLNAKDG